MRLIRWPVSLFNESAEQLDRHVGWDKVPLPFAMASRRLESDRFFTRDFRPGVYTSEGLDWVENNSMRSVLLRHFPELEPVLQGVANPFAPWQRGLA